MAGSDGNRGYLIQTLIALLKSLQLENWESVTVEPRHEAQVVDIVWVVANRRKAIQVKSSINQIGLPDVKRWARDLERNSNADDLELVIVCNGASQKVIEVGHVGRVCVPPPQNLNLASLFNEASHLLDQFLYSCDLKAKSPNHTRQIVKALTTDFSVFASSSKTLSRGEFVCELRNYIVESSPERANVFRTSVLSKEPRSTRKRLSSRLIGREDAIRWLNEVTGDKLIYGQPGIGKTFLLYDYVQKNASSFFLSGHDEDSIERTVWNLNPSSVVIEDAHLNIEKIEFLHRLRDRANYSFAIIADCWPTSRDLVMTRMGITEDACFELTTVTSQDIVDIVHEFGVKASNSFLHMLVAQANGSPGLAAMLIASCLGGTEKNFSEFWNGETITRWVSSEFKRLIGEESIQVLACFAIGGDSGIEVDRVAKVLELSRSRALQNITELAYGGVIDQVDSTRFRVLPASIRAVLVRDYFFPPRSIPIETFLKDRIAFPDIVTNLVNAHSLGAPIADYQLRKLVEKANSLEPWRALIHTSEGNAIYVLEKNKEDLSRIADDLLASIPRRAIAELLQCTESDNRPLASAPDHPLRQIQKWVSSGYPGREALTRRKIAIDILLDQDVSVDLGLKLLPTVMSPIYREMEQNPGKYTEYSLKSGYVLISDFEGIREFWPRVLNLLREENFTNWSSIIDSVKAWLLPYLSGNVEMTTEQRNVIFNSACEILPQLLCLASNHPAILRAIEELARHHQISLSCKIPERYDLLFPLAPSHSNGHEQYQSDLNALVSKARDFGEVLANTTPSQVIKEIKQWADEANIIGKSATDMCGYCCDAISMKVPAQIPWLRAILELAAPPHLIASFLRRAIDLNETGWEQILSECLVGEKFATFAMEIALTHPACPSHIVQEAVEQSRNAIETLRKIVPVFLFRDDVLSMLLTSENAAIVATTAEGIWHRNRKVPQDVPWFQAWQKGVIECLQDEHYLDDIIHENPLIREDWILYLSTSIKARPCPLSLDKLKVHIFQLSDPKRTELLKTIVPTVENARELVIALVGTSESRFELLLGTTKLENLWSVPFHREPDAVWSSFVIKALEVGIDVRRIISETRDYLAPFGLVPRVYHEAIEAWKASFDVISPKIKWVAEYGLREAMEELREWERRERRR